MLDKSNSLMQDLPNQTTEPMGYGPDGGLIAQPRQQTSEHNLKVTPFVLGSLRPPRVVAHATVPRRDRTISLGSVSSHASPHSSRVACCLHRHEPNRYRLMDDSAVNEQPSNKEHVWSTIHRKGGAPSVVSSARASCFQIWGR
jgi:hypothetical protein